MKRIMLVLVFITCAIALVTAQEGFRRGQGRVPGGQSSDPHRGYGYDRNSRQKPEAVNVSGNLTIVKGRIAVTGDDVTYFIGGLQRFVGFIDGLKEGAAVTLEGNAFSVPQNEKIKLLQVHKMTLNGKEYDLGRPRQKMAPNQMQRNGNPPMYQQPRPQGPQGRGRMPYLHNQNQYHKWQHQAQPKVPHGK